MRLHSQITALRSQPINICSLPPGDLKGREQNSLISVIKQSHALARAAAWSSPGQSPGIPRVSSTHFRRRPSSWPLHRRKLRLLVRALSICWESSFQGGFSAINALNGTKSVSTILFYFQPFQRHRALGAAIPRGRYAFNTQRFAISGAEQTAGLLAKPRDVIRSLWFESHHRYRFWKANNHTRKLCESLYYSVNYLLIYLDQGWRHRDEEQEKTQRTHRYLKY